MSIAIVAVLLLAGCGGDEQKPADVPTSVSTLLLSPTRPTSKSADPQVELETILLERYDLYIRTLERVLSTNDPNDPQLREIATGDAFRAVVNSALKNKKAGLVGRGKITSKPVIAAIDVASSTARLNDCQDVGGFRTYSIKTSQLTNPTAPSTKLILVKSTLIRLNGNWVVSSQIVEGSCGD